MFLFPRIFVLFWIASAAAFGGAVWLARALTGGGHPMLLAGHMLGGLFAAFVSLALHTSVMMHVVGTGRSLKLAQPHLPPGRDFVAEQLRAKNLSYPIAVACCLAAVATAIVGGASNFGAVEPAVHRGLAWLTLALHLAALPWEYRVTRMSAELNAEVERLLEAKVADLAARGELPPEGLPMPWQE